MQSKFPGTANLQAQLNEWMENFELEEVRKAAAEAAAADDGWTLVTNKAGRKRAKGAPSCSSARFLVVIIL